MLDRALTPGFGFTYHRRGIGWDRLLTGRTADGLITSDTPPLIDTLFYRKPGRRVIRNQVLGFCGVKVRHVVQFGPIKLTDDAKRARWIARARAMGHAAA